MENLPLDVLIELFKVMTPQDVLHVSQTCHKLHDAASDDRVWIEFCERDFGDLSLLKGILEAAGIAGLRDRSPQVVAGGWKAEYARRKEMQVDVELIQQKYGAVEEALEGLCEDSPDNLVPTLADTLLDILDQYIGFVPAYYSLAFICFMGSHYDEALEFIEMGLEIDPEHTSLGELKGIVEKKVAEIEGEEEDELLLDGKSLSVAFKAVLRQIFAKFDADKDGYWSPKELDHFIFSTNGVHSSPQVLRQMVKNYPSTPQGNLKVEGLFEFFRRQTLDDPEETRKDLQIHGYDRALRKITDAAPVA